MIFASRGSPLRKAYPKPELLKSYRTIRDSCGLGQNMVWTATTDMSLEYLPMILRGRTAWVVFTSIRYSRIVLEHSGWGAISLWTGSTALMKRSAIIGSQLSSKVKL